MTREEKIKALEEKLWNEIAEEKVDLTKVLNYSLEINSPQEFNHAAMNLASFALLEEALFCKCMFRSATSVIDSDIRYVVDEDTLDILLNKEHILIPIEEEYDMLGITVLGLVTAFGGGVLRNIMLDLPMTVFWGQTNLFYVSFVTIFLVYFFPQIATKWKKLEIISDAIGLAAFSISGALYGLETFGTLGPTVVAAILTGTGGGVIRDLLAGKKPSVLCAEVYGSWSILIAVVIYYTTPVHPSFYLIIVGLTILLRLAGLTYNWNLPKNTFTLKKMDNLPINKFIEKE